MKTEKKRTLKGSVLFTVVSVLALMIIFMTSALALASSANKRAHKSYSASQASYTARAAIDSILAAVGTDNKFASAVAGVASGGSIDVDVAINDPSLGKITNAKVSYGGTTSIFDPNKMQWVEKVVLEITADVTLNGETTSIKSRVIQDPVVRSDDGPGYLTMGGKAFNSNGGTIMGGTYVNMGQGPKKPDGTSLGWATLTPSRYIYYNYDSAIDYKELYTLEDHRYWTNDTIEQSVQNSYEAPIVINGSLSTSVDITYYYTQLGKGAVIWGDMIGTNSGVLTDFSESLADLFDSEKNPETYIRKFTEIPFLYVDGNMTLSQDQKIGSQKYSGPFNIFAGSITHEKRGAPEAKNTNIYLMDSDKTSTFNIQNGSKFGGWVNSFYEGDEAYIGSGSIYSKGNVTFEGQNINYINGDLRVEGDLNFDQSNGTLNVSGDLVVGGTLKLTNNATLNFPDGQAYAADVVGNNVQSHGGGLKAGYTQGNLNYVRATNFTYPTAGGGTALAEAGVTYGWLLPTALVDFTTTPGPDGSVDFGGANIDGYYDSNINVPPTDDDPSIPHDKVYKTNVYLNSAGQEVSQAEAVEAGNYWTYNGLTIKNIADFYKDYSYTQTIYPDYATREVLMGVSGPVKGTEGHIALATTTYESGEWYQPTNFVWNWPADTICESGTLKGTWIRNITIQADGHDVNIQFDDGIVFKPGVKVNVSELNGGHVKFYGTKAAEIDGTAGRIQNVTKIVTPPTIPAETYATTLTGVTEVKESCTLTGTFNNSVYVKTQGSDVHVLLSDVNFNNSRIYVDETHGGKVYFYFDGDVKCSYSNPTEVNQTKLIDSVYELMNNWGIEKNLEKPNMIPSDSDYTIEGSYYGGNGATYTYDQTAKKLTIKGSTRLKDTTISGDGSDGIHKVETLEIIAPDNGTLWVELEGNVTFDKTKVIVNDVGSNGKQKGGTVNFYIKGTTNFATNAYMVTQTFWNAASDTSGKKYQIMSDPKNKALCMGTPVQDANGYYYDSTGTYECIPAPNVNVYGYFKDPEDKNAVDIHTEISGTNCFFMTANVRAPYLTWNVGTSASIPTEVKTFLGKVYYDRLPLGDVHTGGYGGSGKTATDLMVFGCLNVADSGNGNDWTLLYVKPTGSGGNTITAANGEHTYAAVSYTDY